MSACSIMAIASVNPVAAAVIAGSYAAVLMAEYRTDARRSSERYMQFYEEWLTKLDDIQDQVANLQPAISEAPLEVERLCKKLQSIQLKADEESGTSSIQDKPTFSGFISNPVDQRLEACRDLLVQLEQDQADLMSFFDQHAGLKRENQALIERCKLAEVVSEEQILAHVNQVESEIRRAGERRSLCLIERRELLKGAQILIDQVLQLSALNRYLLESNGDSTLTERLMSYGKQLDTLKHNLANIVSTQKPEQDAIGLMNQLYLQLKEKVNQSMELAGLKKNILSRVHHHLSEMNYQRVFLKNESEQLNEGDVQPVNRWQIPGGEQVELQIDDRLQVRFEVKHEQSQQGLSQPTGEQLDNEAVSFFKQQEKRWCEDFRSLLRCLNEDGFQFRIAEESSVDIDHIATVVVEDVSDWSTEHKKKKEPKQRYLDD